jgi:ElaB/YqjD/DUF883 family membrane-anchored ribosome-binding protein
MSSPSTASSSTASSSSSFSNAARETAKDARDAIKESAKAASDASGDIQADLQALRDDVARLTQQIADIFAAKGNTAWSRARTTVGDAFADAGGKGNEAVDAVLEVRDNMVDMIDESLKTRPYTTLAIAAAIGFLFGSAWRR